MADAANAALSLTYFLTLLVKTFPVAKDKGALGVLLLLLLVFVAFACAAALVAMRRQVRWVLREAERETGAQLGDMAPPQLIGNPAYDVMEEEEEEEEKEEEEEEEGGRSGAVGAVAALREEMTAMKREHSKYTSARIKAELQKAQAAHAADLQAAVLAADSLQAAHAADLQAAQAAAVQAEAEAAEALAEAKAELAQLKAKTE
jgi:hypothetical protein